MNRMKIKTTFKPIVLTLCLLFIGMQLSVAQTKAISGMVTNSADKQPIPGVSVVEKGTTNGTITNMDGNFSIEVNDNATLIFSFVGMTTREVVLQGQSIVNVALSEDRLEVGEVVVTALGIKRRSKGLTYSTQAVGGDDLTTARDVNMINSLAGKSAGVLVSKSSSGLGGSSKVLIRGSRSTSGNNQPLYVIDGIPMLNSSAEQPVTSIGGTNDSGGRDSGDGISNLNPEDIESMNILKGASAAALYGTQASNGVIVITTKKGRAGATSISFSSNLTVDNVTLLPEFQNSYGMSADGQSWGDKISKKSSHVDDFFRTGVTAMNTLSLSGGSEKMQTYFSYGNTTARGVIEGNKFKRHNLNFRESAKFINDKLSVDANISLVNQSVTNRPVAGGMYLNPLVGLYRFPRGGDMSEYKDNYEVYSVDRNMNVQNWHKPIADMEQNPYWITNRMPSKDRRNRAITSLTAKFDINDMWNVQTRGSVDYTNDRYNQNIYASTHTALSGVNGRYILLNREEIQTYSDVLLNFNKAYDNISLTASVGASVNDMKIRGERLDSRPLDLYYANIFTIGNMQLGHVEQTDIHKQMQSIFGTAQLGLKDYLFLDVTARNDWASSLAYTDNAKSGFFYPSFGLSGVLSDMMELPSAVNFAKVRASWSEVGNDIPVHISYPTNRIDAGGNMVFNSTAPFDNLKPEKSRSIEVGTEWKLFNNKVTFDLTYYKTNTTNQLFTLPAPAGADYSEYYVNAGDIQNTGFEGIVNITPIAERDFYWQSSFNFSTNKNEVIEIHKDLPEFRYGGQTSNSYWMKVEEGGSLGDIYGVGFNRDDNGKIVLDSDGLPEKSESFIKLGNAAPDFTLGWNNTLNIKKVSVNILMDGSFGGDVMSLTQADLDQRGVTKTTATDRNNKYVMLEGNKISDVQGFYTRVGGRDGITEHYMYDATNIRLREVSLSYKFDKDIFGEKSFVKSASLSLVGRNLFFIYLDAPYDPNTSLSTGNNLQGVDVYGMPATTSYGVNLKVNF